MNLKIGIVTGEYPPHQGGVGDFTREVAHALAALGHEVHVITHKAATPSDQVRVHPVISSWNLQSLIFIRSLASQLKLDLLNIQYQAAAYGMTPPIHFLPLMAGLPSVMTFHDLRIPYLFPKAGALRWQAIMLLAKTAKGVIVTNPEDRLTLERENVKRLVEIPIGSNIIVRNQGLEVRGQKSEVRKKYGISEDDLVIGYFGFLNASKGGETLFKAISQLDPPALKGIPPFSPSTFNFAELPKAKMGGLRGGKLLLIGGKTGTSDPTNIAYAQQLDDLATQLGISDRIIRTGYLSPEETTQAFYACDMMAMPYEDGASFRRGTFMACLAHGMPTITTQPVVPLVQLKHGENIYLVPPHNPQALTQAIITLQNDSTLRERIAHGALELSDEFTWDKIAKQTANFFETVLNKNVP